MVGTWVVHWLSLWLRSLLLHPGIKSHIGLPVGSLLLSLPMSLPLSVWKVTQLRMTPKAQNEMAPARTPMPLPLGTDAVAPSDDVGH